MITKPHWAYRLLNRARREDGGNVAIIVALAIMPLTVGALGAADIARAMSAKVQLQDALDAAALAASHVPGTDPTALTAAGQHVLTQNLALSSDFHLASYSFAYGTGGTIVASASVTVSPFVAGLVTHGALTVGASSEIVRAMDNIELALVLDNTGSMNQSLGTGGSKIAALKTAASSMVDTLSAAAAASGQPNAVKIAVVPYTMTVNVGSANQNASWISPGLPSAYGADIFATAGTNRFTLFSQMGKTWGGCVEARPSPYDVTEAPPTASTPGTLYVPFFAPDEPGSTQNSNTWNNEPWYNNYLADVTTSNTWSVRQGYVAKYNTQTFINSGSSAPSGYAYGPNAGCTIQPLTRLTTNYTAVKTAINAMTVGGDTDIKAGLMWGWHTLSPNAPFSDGVAYHTAQHDKIIVLMTDGQNHNVPTSSDNNSLYSGLGYIWQNRIGLGTSSTLAQRIAVLDQKLGQACANAKAAGIIMYVVVLVDPNVDQSTVRGCASSSDNLYNVTDSSQLNGVFASIAGSVSKLRISK